MGVPKFVTGSGNNPRRIGYCVLHRYRRNHLGNAALVKFAEGKFARVKHGCEHGILSHEAFHRIQLAMLRFLFQESLTICRELCE